VDTIQRDIREARLDPKDLTSLSNYVVGRIMQKQLSDQSSPKQKFVQQPGGSWVVK